MQKISFEDTTVVKSPYVIIDGVEHEVYNGTYQGGTDLNAETFNTMQNNIETAINDVVDSGTNSNGSWIKYDDGILICHNAQSFTVDIATQWGSIYTSEGSATGFNNFPVEFISAPTVTFGAKSTTANFWMIKSASYPASKSNAGRIQLARPTSVSSVPVVLDYIAIGRWK